jgi:hypothetical protein
MSLQPATYEEALARHKPLSRCQIRSAAQKQGVNIKPRRTNTIKRKTAKKKAKRVKVSTLKKRAWTEFSIFIRTRRADEQGFVVCVTCGERKRWTEVDAGHFIAGRLNNNLFDERGCNEQCKRCNGPRCGNGAMYYKWMLANHGQEVIDELISQNDKTHKWAPGELQGLFEKYKALNAANPICQIED